MLHAGKFAIFPALIAAAVLLSPGCKHFDGDESLFKDDANQPSTKLSIDLYRLGQGFKTPFARPTETTCVESTVTGLGLDAGSPPDLPVFGEILEERTSSDPPAPTPLSDPAAGGPVALGARTVPPGSDVLFIDNEFVALYDKNGLVDPSLDEAVPVKLSEGAAGAFGLQSADPKEAPCSEKETNDWITAVAQARARGTMRDTPLIKPESYSASTLEGLRQSLSLDANAAVKALGQEGSLETRLRMGLNYEAESEYFTTDTVIISSERDEINRPRLAAVVDRTWNETTFFDRCGDAFITSRALGARYQQYYLMTRVNLERRFEQSVTGTLKLKLGPLRKTVTRSSSYDFVESNRVHAVENRRYVAAPWVPAKFPESLACMREFLRTLPSAVQVARPGTGVPVGFNTAGYPGNVTGATVARPLPRVDPITRNRNETAVHEFLTLMDEMAKYAGSIHHAFQEPEIYERLASIEALQAKFLELMGQRWEPHYVFDPTPKAGLIATALREGQKLLEAYLADPSTQPTMAARIGVWRAAIDRNILPKRFAFTTIVRPELGTIAQAREFCGLLPRLAQDRPTLAMVMEQAKDYIWRFPRAKEALALQHGLRLSLTGIPETQQQIFVTVLDEYKVGTSAVLSPGDAKPRLVRDAGDDGVRASAMCIYGPADVR